MTTAVDRHAAERAVRARIHKVDGEREGWTCIDCPDANGYSDPPEVASWLVGREDGAGADPLCHFHKDERIHEAIPYGQNCTECGVLHSALWPNGELGEED